MATSFGAATALAAASVTENAHKSSTCLPLCHRHFFLRSNCNRVSFRLSPRPKLRFSAKSGWSNSSVVKAQLNEVAADGSSKAAANTPSNPGVPPAGAKSNEPLPTALASEEPISEFVTQVASLVKLVDSKDIVELRLKQPDCEILIRKKEALPSLPSPPITYVQSQTPPAPIVPVSAPSTMPATVPSPPKTQPSKSSHPPLKCPMAGTFYRSPAPGEPPFVKADQSGTIIEIPAENGKPVSVDTPLFVIEP